MRDGGWRLDRMSAADWERLEFLADISTEHEWELQRLRDEQSAERERREHQEWVASIFVPDRNSPRGLGGRIVERKWDPAKHPRRDGPPNAGWWASTGGGGASGTSSSSARSADTRSTGGPSDASVSRGRDDPRLSLATGKSAEQGVGGTTRSPEPKPTLHSPAHGAAVFFTAAARTTGHHWVPRTVFDKLGDKMTKAALSIFQMGTEAPEWYNHAYDPWNGVKHSEYSAAVNTLLEDWIREGKGKLTASRAREFMTWIANGECLNPDFLAKHKATFATVFRWRTGFKQSIVVAARAMEINPKLTAGEAKAIAQVFVNGKATSGLSKDAAKIAAQIIGDGKAILKITAKRVLPGLLFLSAATAAKRGWAGDGHTGSGAWGALNEAARDAVSADLVEKIVFPSARDLIDAATNIIAPGLNDPTRHRFFWRNGHRYDAITGAQLD